MTTAQPGRPARSAEPSLIGQAGWTFFPIALVARLPFAMMVIGLLTLVVAERGSLALGGAASAATGVGTAIFGPLLGSAADRFGQRRTLLVTAVLNAAALAAMPLTTGSSAADGLVLANAFLVGATATQVAPMSRSRLVGLIGRAFKGPRRESVMSGAMAYESAADEAVFVFGPVVVGVLATVLGPASPLLVAAALTAFAVVAFALHPSATVVPAREGDRPVRAPARLLLRPDLLVTVVGMVGMGLYFGSSLTALTSFMSDRGLTEQAGLVSGVTGVTSTAFALGTAWLPSRFSLAARWIVCAAVLLLGTVLLAVAPDIPVAVVALAVVGAGVGPTLVGIYHLAADRSPPGRSATVMTMLTSGIVVGQAASAAVTGGIAQQAGTGAALLVPVAAAGVVLAAGVVNALAGRRPVPAPEGVRAGA